VGWKRARRRRKKEAHRHPQGGIDARAEPVVRRVGEATAGGEVRNHELVQGVAIHHAVQERRPLGAGADDARDAPAVLELEREALEALGAVDRVEEPCEADGLRVAPAPQLFVRAWTRAVLSLSTAIDSHS
jgi:hypothetical protein